MYAYLHHSAGPNGPFQTVSVEVRRTAPKVDGTKWRGHIRAGFQIRERGCDWRNVYRDPINPAWAGSAAPQNYAIIEGRRAAVSIRH